jgi:hypothetical protein
MACVVYATGDCFPSASFYGWQSGDYWRRPGGLMTAYQLQERCPVPFETTIYEGSSRLGGKILTEQFSPAGAAYEAGAADLYDYSQIGEDPLRQLVEKLGLTVKPMAGRSVVPDDRISFAAPIRSGRTRRARPGACQPGRDRIEEWHGRGERPARRRDT